MWILCEGIMTEELELKIQRLVESLDIKKVREAIKFVEDETRRDFEDWIRPTTI